MDLNRRRFLNALIASAATTGVLSKITGWPRRYRLQRRGMGDFEVVGEINEFHGFRFMEG